MADWRAWREMAAVTDNRKKIVPETDKEMTAYREMEAHPEEEPTSVETKPEAAEHREVPVDDALRILVREPKERRRDWKLAAECCRQTAKDATWENRGPRKELAVTNRRATRRVEAARQEENRRKTSRCATVAQCWRNNFKKETPQGAFRCQRTGRKGVKTIGGRQPLCQTKEVPTKKGIGGCRLGQRSHPGRRGTQEKTTYEAVNVKNRKLLIRFTAKSWTLWRGRPPPKRKKGNCPYGRNQ